MIWKVSKIQLLIARLYSLSACNLHFQRKFGQVCSAFGTEAFHRNLLNHMLNHIHAKQKNSIGVILQMQISLIKLLCMTVNICFEDFFPTPHRQPWKPCSLPYTTSRSERNYSLQRIWLWALIMEPFGLSSVSQSDMIELSTCAELLLIKSICLESSLYPSLPFVTQMDIEGFSHRSVSSEHTFGMNIYRKLVICLQWMYCMVHCISAVAFGPTPATVV